MREPEPKRGREIESFLWQENRVWLTVKCWPSQEEHVQNRELKSEKRRNASFLAFLLKFALNTTFQ